MLYILYFHFLIYFLRSLSSSHSTPYRMYFLCGEIKYRHIEVHGNMKMQKELRRFCPKCKTHTVQSVSIYKKGRDRKTAEGARRHAEDKKGYGGQKFPELKRTAKTTKKITLRYTCKNCQRKTMNDGIRMRKMEIQA
jgi:large subunit ribosomal protein L44e